MMFIPIIFIGLIIWTIFAFTRRSDAPWRSNEESAIEILKRRYARGEISQEEFTESKKNLL